MRTLDRLRAGLFSDPPKYGRTDSEAYRSVRRNAQELADAIEAEMASQERTCTYERNAFEIDFNAPENPPTDVFVCSECGCRMYWPPKCCPECGAKVVQDA